jgi:hypothetical protein
MPCVHEYPHTLRNFLSFLHVGFLAGYRFLFPMAFPISVYVLKSSTAICHISPIQATRPICQMSIDTFCRIWHTHSWEVSIHILLGCRISAAYRCLCSWIHFAISFLVYPPVFTYAIHVIAIYITFNLAAAYALALALLWLGLWSTLVLLLVQQE